MSQRHRRALLVTALMTLLSAAPLAYLWHLHSRDLTGDLKIEGHVPEFVYTFANSSLGFTHFDTLRSLTVVAVMRDHCADGCPELKAKLTDFYAWHERHLQSKHRDIATPQPIRFVVMAGEGYEQLTDLAGWSVVNVKPGMSYLVPDNHQNDSAAALVLIDDSGRYRAHLPLGDEHSLAIAQQELAKITSTQYLQHYLTTQALIYERAKAVARGKLPADAEQEQ